MANGVTLKDLERVMGRKATKISDYEYDPETGSVQRSYTFDLKPDAKPSKQKKSK